MAVEQVKKTFGLPDSTYQKIKSVFILPNRLPAIECQYCQPDNLKSHPYIRYAIANAIVQYRNQHGEFGSLEGPEEDPAYHGGCI